MTSEKAAEFCFGTIGTPLWDVGSAYEDFQGLEFVKRELVKFQWVQNHFRWIVWKLACLVRTFPKLLSSFTPNEVLRQLLVRYTTEFDQCKRSAIKKIIERDDIPSKPIILVVAKIFSTDEIEVSDGWYSIRAHLDSLLSCLVKERKIKEGVKIICVGASVFN